MQRQRQRRFLKAVAIGILMLVSISSYSKSIDESAERYQLNVNAQNVEQALRSLASASGKQLLFPYDQMEALKIISISGRYTLEEALDIILKDTSLSGELTEEGVILVTLSQKKSERGREMNNRKKTLAAVIGFFVGAGGLQQAYGQDGEAATTQGQIDEIIVTATKRETSLQETPVSVAVIGAEEITRRGIVGMEDYLKSTPGVSQLERGPGQNAVVIRGIGLASLEATLVGYYFGEVPVGSVPGTFESGAVDIKTVDIEQVEILRGPQGTLYGAASMGGTVRVIPKSPKLNEFEGNVEASYSNTSELGGNNSMVQGVVNIPLVEDKFAARIAFYQYNNDGYVENIAGSDADALANANLWGVGDLAIDEIVGEHSYTGGRLSLLWQPLEDLSISAMYFSQKLDQDGFIGTDATLSKTYQQRVLQFGGDFEGRGEHLLSDVEISNLVINYDLDWGTIVSSSSWQRRDREFDRDAGRFFFGGMPAGQLVKLPDTSFSQEIRLASDLGGKFQFLAGAYYEDLRSENINSIYFGGADPAQNPFSDSDDLILQVTNSTETEQIAIFGEISYQLSDQVKIAIGARSFDFDQTRAADLSGALIGAVRSSTNGSGEKGQTYKVNLAFTPDDGTLLYAQWAQGFRLGKPIANPTLPEELCDLNGDGLADGTNLSINLPDRLDSDRLETYELGVKMGFFDERMVVNMAVYHSDWTDIPVVVRTDCGFNVTANFGSASSRGFEIESTLQLNDALLIRLGGSYIDPKLTETTSLGNSGDRLPNSPGRNLHLGIQYDFTKGRRPVYANVDYSYVGEFFNGINETGSEAGGYGKVDASINVEATEKFNVELFIHNLTNEDSFTSFEIVGVLSEAYRLKPRTAGLKLRYNF